MKKVFACLLALNLMLSLAACGGNPDNPGTNPTNGPKETEAPTEWSVPKDDYSSMTADQLYELAKKEGGVIRVYATTADANTAVRKFQKQYPDLQVEYISQDTNQVASKIQMESQSGNVNADVLMVKDNTGEIYHTMVLRNMLELYYPEAVCSHLDQALLRYGMPVYATFNPWYYNTEKYPDGCPIQSWWDIVEGYDEASGKFTSQKWTIYSKDITGPSYTALWTQLIVDGDKMAEQYKAQYGKDLTYTYMSKLANVPGIMELPENNGGVELFYRFSQMMITELADGDAVVAAVDESLNGPTLGLTSASKLNSQLNVAWVTGLSPYTAFQACNYLYCVTGSDNPAGARLYILFCMGGEDGQSGCYTAFDKAGAWSIRDDIVYEKTAMPIDQVNLTTPDFESIYQMCSNVQAYWTKWHANVGK